MAPVNFPLTSDPVRVLVADDSAFHRRQIVRFLERDDKIKVVGEAANGREAIRLTQRLRPDVVTMDVVMPVMDGIELIGHIRKAWPTQKVLALSGGGARLGADTTIAMVSDLGADVVMQKPVDNDTLLEKIDALLAG